MMSTITWVFRLRMTTCAPITARRYSRGKWRQWSLKFLGTGLDPLLQQIRTVIRIVARDDFAIALAKKVFAPSPWSSVCWCLSCPLPLPWPWLLPSAKAGLENSAAAKIPARLSPQRRERMFPPV
jgi:hypothetical protein